MLTLLNSIEFRAVLLWNGERNVRDGDNGNISCQEQLIRWKMDVLVIGYFQCNTTFTGNRLPLPWWMSPLHRNYSKFCQELPDVFEKMRHIFHLGNVLSLFHVVLEMIFVVAVFQIVSCHPPKLIMFPLCGHSRYFFVVTHQVYLEPLISVGETTSPASSVPVISCFVKSSQSCRIRIVKLRGCANFRIRNCTAFHT